MDLSPAARSFILHWGEMGGRWGVNRTVAQIHALLFVSERALNAEEMAETLAVARSNVSNSLRELQSWGIVRVAHVLGDRRDHFETTKDVWELFRTIVDERKKREVDQTVAVLRKINAEAARSSDGDDHAHRQLAAMLEFFETMTALYEQVKRLSPGAVVRLAKVGDELTQLLGRGS